MGPSKKDDTAILVVSVNPYSDGDPSHRPTDAQYRKFDPDDGYLEKLATLWMERRKERKPLVRYFLDRLPAGYCVYGRSRTNNPQHIDKWCYGHPNHKLFDSPNRFFPHFLHLMENGTNDSCLCTVCTGPKSHRAAANGPVTRGTIVAPKGRATLTEAGKVDEEGNPDVYRNLVDKLRRFGPIDALITEPMSMDWRAERRLLHDSLQTISQQPTWLPRIAELVLYVRDLRNDEVIAFDPGTNHHKIWNISKDCFIGYPRWEAGVVAQVAEEQPQILELIKHLKNDRKTYDINYSGYRIEPFSDPNGQDKSFSKRYKYVSLRQVRPLAYFNELVKGVPGTEWDQTIGNAITAMSTVSLVDKYRFKGTWPTADIFCRGIYIGSELIIVGDVVRILPSNKAPSKDTIDVLKITAIKLVLSNLDKASANDNDNGHPYNSAIHVQGKSYTLDRNRAHHDLHASPTPFAEPPQPIRGYGFWYHRQPPTQSTVIPFSSILTRCHSPEAMTRWFSNSNSDAAPSAHLATGLFGILQARSFSTSNLRFIAPGRSWFWADHRVEALDLQTLNGVDVARCDRARDPKRWRREIKVLEGTAGAADLSAVTGPVGLGKGALGLARGSGMVRSAIGILESKGRRGRRSQGLGCQSGEKHWQEGGSDIVMASIEDRPALPDDDEEMEDCKGGTSYLGHPVVPNIDG